MRRYIVGARNGSMAGTLAVYDRTTQRWYSTSQGIPLFTSEAEAQALADQLNAQCEWCGEVANREQGIAEPTYAGPMHRDCFDTYCDRQGSPEDQGASPTEVR